MLKWLSVVCLLGFGGVANATLYSEPFLFDTTDQSDWVPSTYAVTPADIVNQYDTNIRVNCADSTDPYLQNGTAGSEESFDIPLKEETWVHQKLIGVVVKLCVRVKGTLSGSVNLRTRLYNLTQGTHYDSSRLTFTGGATSPTRFTTDITFSPGYDLAENDDWAVGFVAESGSSSDLTKVVIHGMWSQARWNLAPATAPIPTTWEQTGPHTARAVATFTDAQIIGQGMKGAHFLLVGTSTNGVVNDGSGVYLFLASGSHTITWDIDFNIVFDIFTQKCLGHTCQCLDTGSIFNMTVWGVDSDGVQSVSPNNFIPFYSTNGIPQQYPCIND